MLIDVPSPRRFPLAFRIKRLLPRSLFGRTLLIFILPPFLMLAGATYVFFNRHWYVVTHRMTFALAGDIASIVELLQKNHPPLSFDEIEDLAAKKMFLQVRFSPGETLSEEPSSQGSIGVIFKRSLDEVLDLPYTLDMTIAPETIGVHVQVPQGVYTFQTSEKRVYTPTTQVFVLWLTGSSILLTTIALIFMRNQIRPIRRLAKAAEAIGKNREVPWFKVEGSSEVRQAGAALMIMRDRLKRQISQRTAMLSGVSHDLRTPLTRMKLQLELMGASAETAELSSDIAEMEAMLNAYLAFAKGEEGEPTTSVQLSELLAEIVASARRQNQNIVLETPEDLLVIARRAALKRCITNLTTNALRYGKHAKISTARDSESVTILIDDDGPGIPVKLREDVFRPFTRLEQSRNQATGGIGLGLTIARDIARSHGGDVILEESPLGGVRARVRLPV